MANWERMIAYEVKSGDQIQLGNEWFPVYSVRKDYPSIYIQSTRAIPFHFNKDTELKVITAKVDDNPNYISEEDAALNCAAGRHEWSLFGEGPAAYCLHCAATRRSVNAPVIPAPKTAPAVEGKPSTGCTCDECGRRTNIEFAILDGKWLCPACYAPYAWERIGKLEADNARLQAEIDAMEADKNAQAIEYATLKRASEDAWFGWSRANNVVGPMHVLRDVLGLNETEFVRRDEPHVPEPNLDPDDYDYDRGVDRSTPAQPAAGDDTPVVVLEPAASYVVYDLTAYGPFWKFDNAMAYRSKFYPNGVVRQGKDREVKQCKEFVDPGVWSAEPEQPKPTPRPPSKAVKLSKLTPGQIKLLKKIDRDNREGWLCLNIDGNERRVRERLQKRNLVEFIEETSGLYRMGWRLTDAGLVALRNADEETRKS